MHVTGDKKRKLTCQNLQAILENKQNSLIYYFITDP